MDEEKGKKFKGFHDDMGEDSDEDVYDEEEDDYNSEEHVYGIGGSGELAVISDGSSALMEHGEVGISWKDKLEREREEAIAVIAKGEKKQLARMKHENDIELVQVYTFLLHIMTISFINTHANYFSFFKHTL